jgi:hypothetical protein
MPSQLEAKANSDVRFYIDTKIALATIRVTRKNLWSDTVPRINYQCIPRRDPAVILTFIHVESRI